MGRNLSLSCSTFISFLVENPKRISITSGSLKASSPAILKASPQGTLPFSLSSESR